jgi:hypothetical protein
MTLSASCSVRSGLHAPRLGLGVQVQDMDDQPARGQGASDALGRDGDPTHLRREAVGNQQHAQGPHAIGLQIAVNRCCPLN